MRAQELLAEKYGVAADVWSVTSFTELRREALECERWNRLHPTEKPRRSYLETLLANEKNIGFTLTANRGMANSIVWVWARVRTPSRSNFSLM